MSASANRHRRHVEFEVGDLVWLKLLPYRQQSVAKPLSTKMTRRSYGPFAVLQRVGPVAYRLQLPEGSRIPDVFHVSLLREFVTGVGAVELPKEFRGDRPVVRPVKILDSQIIWHNGDAVEHVLVKWSDGTESPSWEPIATVQVRFLNLLLEDKEAPNRGELLRTHHLRRGDTPTPPVEPPTEATVEDSLATTGGEEISREEGEPNGVESKEDTMTRLRPREHIKPPERFQNYTAK